MTIEEAIKTAIQYEAKVRDVYTEAVKNITDPAAKRILKVLADEEHRHVEYLHSKRLEWESTGKITVRELATVIPSKEVIAKGISDLKSRMTERDSSAYTEEIQILRNALDMEVETSNFYKRMVKELKAEGRQMFSRFVEIEEGHEAIVQAQIDALSGMGYWFDSCEFNLEAG